MGHILSVCVSQADFRAHQNLYRMSVVHNVASVCGCFGIHVQCLLDLPIDYADCTRPISPFCLFVVNLFRVAFPAENMTSTNGCVQEAGICEMARLHTAEFLFASVISSLKAAIASTANIGPHASVDLFGNVRLLFPAVILLI